MDKQESLTYKTYSGMKQRCYNKNCSQYKNYGARGITVSDRWLESYANFVEDMGIKPVGLSLDRIDNDKGYSKENCRWADKKVQRNNQRRSHIYELDGETMCRGDWAIRAGISDMALRARLRRGMTLREAIEKPVNENLRRNSLKGNAKRWLSEGEKNV